MIYHLQKKVIRICGIAVLIVFSVIFLLICGFSIKQLNETMDAMLDRTSDNGGKPPEWGDENDRLDTPMGRPGGMAEAPPFSTRFFTVQFDKRGGVVSVDVDFISSISEEEAEQYALKTYESGRERGWLGDFRYKKYQTGQGTAIVYADGSMNRFISGRLLLSTGIVLIVSAVAIWLIVIFFSRRAVQPVAESYEKQKQFITDANHELKTPLTLVMANLDILESEIGENEWLSDIRSESERMSALVNELVALARMDEDRTNLEMRQFSLSDMLVSVVSEFRVLAQERGKFMEIDLAGGIDCIGDEAAIRQMISILLDNAIKYCDVGGDITIRLEKRKHPALYIENTYKDVGEAELDRMFDRFYRADKARTFTGGFGVGLSIAKAIIMQHKGEIKVYKKDENHIGFKVIWKS